MICIPATGYDAFDIDACKERGIVVSNVRGYATNTVPEHTFALILALRRGIVGYRQDVIDGRWQQENQFCFFTHPINDLAGSTLGIFGEGALGQGVARLGQAFGMRTLFAAHKNVQGLGPLYTPCDEVLETADVITLHSPLMPATRNMIAAPEFAKMKKKPLLINCARGGLVNEADLVDALDQRPDRRRRFRLPDRGAAEARQPAVENPRPPQCHRDAARRLGQQRGDADAVGSGRPAHREFPRRPPSNRVV